jgi:hypothetical protein
MSVSRRDGETSIDKLQLQGFEGLSVSGAGAIGGAGSSFEAHIAAPKAAPLIALSRLVLPQRAVGLLNARRGALEPLSLALSAQRAASSPVIEATLSGTAAASRLDAKATLDADLVARSGEIALSAPEASALLDQLGFAVGPNDPLTSDSPTSVKSDPLGRGEMKITAKPADAGSLAVTASLSAGEARLTGDGTLRLDQGAPEGRGGFNVVAPDLAAAQRLLGFSQRLGGDQRLSLAGGWLLSADGLALERLNARFLGMSLDGELKLGFGGEERITGTLRAPTLSVPGLAALALGPTQGGQGPWGATRFPAFRPPRFPVSLRLTSALVDLGGGVTGRDGKLSLEIDERGLKLASGMTELGEGELSGEWSIERDGGLARSALHLSVDGIDLKTLVPGAGFAGKLSGRLELAGAGETLSQIVASSGGSGSLRLADGWLEQAAIGGLRRAFKRAVSDDNLMDKTRLASVVATETARGALNGVNFEAPLVATNGIVRAAIPRLALADGDGAEATAALDLKTFSLDARLGLSTVTSDKPENPVPLSAAITWKGSLFAPKREADANALLQAVSVERLRIELERIELMEYDQREQAMFNRRLKAGRQKAMPLPAPPPPEGATASPSTSTAAPTSQNGAEGETAAKEPAASASPLPATAEPPASPTPLVRAPQPPPRPAQPPLPDAQKTGPAPSVEPAPGATQQLAPLPPEITVPAAPAVVGVPGANPPLRRPPAPRPPLLLRSPD